MRKGIPAFIRSMPSGLIGQFVPGDSGSEPGPAPSCAITLSGDINALFGAQTPTIDGQTFSVASVTVDHACSTPYETVAVRRALPAASNVVWTGLDGQITSFTDSGSYIRTAMYGFDGADNPNVGVYLELQASGDLYCKSAAGLSFPLATGVPSLAGWYIGVSDTGSVFVYEDGETVTELGDFNADWYTAMSAAESLILLGVLDAGGDETDYSASGTFITDQAAWSSAAKTALAGGEDWCGQEIVV